MSNMSGINISSWLERFAHQLLHLFFVYCLLHPTCVVFIKRRPWKLITLKTQFIVLSCCCDGLNETATWMKVNANGLLMTVLYCEAASRLPSLGLYEIMLLIKYKRMGWNEQKYWNLPQSKPISCVVFIKWNSYVWSTQQLHFSRRLTFQRDKKALFPSCWTNNEKLILCSEIEKTVKLS